MLDFHDAHVLTPHKILPAPFYDNVTSFSWMMMASYTICELRHVLAVLRRRFNFISSFIYSFIGNGNGLFNTFSSSYTNLQCVYKLGIKKYIFYIFTCQSLKLKFY